MAPRELRPYSVSISQLNLLEDICIRQAWQLSFKFPLSKAVHSLPINFQPTLHCIPIPSKKKKKGKSLIITLLTVSFASGCTNTITQSLTEKVISTFQLQNLQLLNPAVWKMVVLIYHMHVSKFLHTQRQTSPSQIQDAIFNYFLMASSDNLGFLTAHNH